MQRYPSGLAEALVQIARPNEQQYRKNENLSLHNRASRQASAQAGSEAKLIREGRESRGKGTQKTIK